MQSMKDALTKGEGGGLQSLSQQVGEQWAEAKRPQTGAQSQADEASTSLRDMANPGKGAATTSGTSISAADQIKNTSTGTADHLEMGYRK